MVSAIWQTFCSGPHVSSVLRTWRSWYPSAGRLFHVPCRRACRGVEQTIAQAHDSIRDPLTGPPSHWSPDTLLEPIGPPSHWSPISLVPHLFGPPFHSSTHHRPNPMVPHLIGSPSHWSPNSSVPHPIGPPISTHASPIPLVPHLIGPPDSLVPHLNGPPSHWSPSHWSL